MLIWALPIWANELMFQEASPCHSKGVARHALHNGIRIRFPSSIECVVTLSWICFEFAFLLH